MKNIELKASNLRKVKKKNESKYSVILGQFMDNENEIKLIKTTRYLAKGMLYKDGILTPSKALYRGKIQMSS